LPIDLQPKSCIIVTDTDSRILLDKLGYVIYDFTHVARYIITTIGGNSVQKQEATTSKITTDYTKTVALGLKIINTHFIHFKAQCPFEWTLALSL
ncbi:unnamed protein product, partial [Didymodactylos carnosus]